MVWWIKTKRKKERRNEDVEKRAQFSLVIQYQATTNIVRVIKSRRMRRAGHVARMGEKRGI
jgi:O-glycosyl hydrolase